MSTRRIRLATLWAAAACAAVVVGLVQNRRGRSFGPETSAGRVESHHDRALRLEAVAAEQQAAGAETESTLRAAVDAWSRVIAAQPDRVQDRTRLVGSILRLTEGLENAGRWEAAERLLDRASLACSTLPLVSQGDPRIARLLAIVLDRHGGLLETMGRSADARDRRAQAAAAARSLAQSPARDSDDVRRLIVILLHAADAFQAANRAPEAVAALEEARPLALKLSFHPTRDGDDLELAAQILDRLALLETTDAPAKVQALLEEALGLRERRLAMFEAAAPKPDPEVLDQALARLADSDTALSRRLSPEGERDRALTLARRALDHQTRRIGRTASVRLGRGRAMIDLAVALRERGDLDQALKLARRGAVMLDALHREDRLDPAARLAASLAWWTVCDLELARGDPQASARSVAAYLEIEPSGYDEALESCRFLCRCAALAGPKLADGYADSALAALKSAIQRGFRGREEIAREAGYRPIRGTAGFEALSAEITALEIPEGSR